MKLHKGYETYYVDYTLGSDLSGKMKQETIKELKVCFRHEMNINEPGKYNNEVRTVHRTEAVIYDKDKQPLAACYAYCSIIDAHKFSKQLGRTIALGRLLKMKNVKLNKIVDTKTKKIIK